MKTIISTISILFMVTVYAFCGMSNTPKNDFRLEENHLPVIDTLHFVNPPADITVSCNEFANTGQPLQVVNNDPNCLTNTSVTPTVLGSGSICGGTAIYQWTFTDICGHTVLHTQYVSVSPISPSSFVNPPASGTYSYNQLPLAGDSLQITNNGSGGCSVNEYVTPVKSGSITTCGGTLSYTWTYTDLCNRTYTHTQTLSVTPAPQAYFINPPADVSVDCSYYPLSNIASLTITNGISGTAGINTTVAPIVVDSVVNCNGYVDLIYTYTDNCNRLTYYKQRITVYGKKYQLAGFCFTDANANNIFDSNKDFPLSNVAIKVEGDSVTHYTNDDGYYSFYLDSGMQDIKYIINFGSWIQDTIVKSINVIKSENYLFVGYKPQGSGAESALVTLTSSGVVCKSLSNLYAQVFNNSSSLLSGYLIVQFDPKTYFTSMNPLPSGGEANYLLWNFIDLPPGKTFSPSIKFWVPDIVNGDDSLLFKAFVVSSVTNDTLSTFTFDIKFDCAESSNLTKNFPDRQGEDNYTLVGENITYQINFNNKLSVPVKSIKISNTIDKNLDISSLKIHKASHKFNVFRINNELIFVSDSIDLNTNSEGYILFSLAQNPGLKEKTVIEHEAIIKLNNTVTDVTNKAINTIVSILPCDLLNTKVQNLDNTLIVTSKGTIYSWYECGNTQLLHSGNQFQPNKNGSYYCIVEGPECKTISDCVDYISTQTEDVLNEEQMVYPNPVNDFLYFKTNKKLYVEVIDVYGNIKAVTKENFVDFRDMVPGIYFVKIGDIREHKVYRVVKE
jgi:Secretion system C-terminal sorting domain